MSPRGRKAAATADETVVDATAVDCSQFAALAPDTRALIYTGIDSMRDLAIIANAVHACGLVCEIERTDANSAKVAVYAARRRKL